MQDRACGTIAASTPPETTSISTPPPNWNAWDCSWLVEALSSKRVRTVTYAQYRKLTSAVQDPPLRLLVDNAAFANGPIKLHTGPVHVLVTEDIEFQPNVSDGFRVKGADYRGPAFSLGFFCAVTVMNSHGTVLDLGGHYIGMTLRFRAHQRFFGTITLGQSPFSTNKGPANFGPLLPTRNVIVKNGSLISSAHHGVLGNEVTNVILQDLVVSDYEVAAVHFNMARDVTIERVYGSGTRNNFGLSFMFSQGLFILPVMRELAMDAKCALTFDNGEKVFASKVVEALACALEAAVAHVECATPVKPYLDCDARVFVIPSSSTDGSAYGCVINGKHPAVGPFKTNVSTEERSKNVLIRDCVFENVASEISTGLFCIDGATGSANGGPFGDLCDFSSVMTVDDVAKASFAGHALFHAQLLCHQEKPTFGTSFISPEVRRWCLSGEKGMKFQLVRNLDSMRHILKGTIGIFIQGAECVRLERTAVRRIRQSATAPARVPNSFFALRGDAPSLDAIGICVAASNDVLVSDVDVECVESTAGNAIGIALLRGTHDTTLNKVSVLGLSTPKQSLAAPGVSMVVPVMVEEDPGSVNNEFVGCRCPRPMLRGADGSKTTHFVLSCPSSCAPSILPPVGPSCPISLVTRKGTASSEAPGSNRNDTSTASAHADRTRCRRTTPTHDACGDLSFLKPSC
jgi:hypothetical protein